MDNGNSAAHQVREAAERIRQEQQAWQGVGLMAVENLETGACGVVLVPADVPRPDWSEELRYGAPGWDRGEDVALAAWLSRWYASVDTLPTANWQKLQNLLNLHCPAALVSSMPEPGRRLRVRHGLGVHALPPAEDRPGLLARMVAWAAAWEELALPDGTRACASWLNPSNALRAWLPVAAAMGARGRTREERLKAGGMHEWGLLIAWPSVVDLVVAFLLAQADATDATAQPAADGAQVPDTGRRHAPRAQLSRDRCRVVLIAVHERVTVGKPGKAQPDRKRQRAAYAWACLNRELDIRQHLEHVTTTWLPTWFVIQLRQQHDSKLTVHDLLGVCRSEAAFETSVRAGLLEKQRMPPGVACVK